MNDLLQDITLEKILEICNQENLEKTKHLYNAVQKILLSGSSPDDEGKLAKVKIGTVLTICLIEKFISGKKPGDFSAEDWADVIGSVSHLAVDIDGKEYSRFIFTLYADYIDESVKLVAIRGDADNAEKIRLISEELREKNSLLEQGQIKETAYVEDCLWLCFEAMVKLLASYTGTFVGEEVALLINNTAAYAFEYARYSLYKKEQELLAEYLEKQKVIDAELQKKFDEYVRLLSMRTDSYNSLIDKAFNPDFMTALKASVELAKETGVEENEILSTEEDIDSYFMDDNL